MGLQKSTVSKQYNRITKIKLVLVTSEMRNKKLKMLSMAQGEFLKFFSTPMRLKIYHIVYNSNNREDTGILYKITKGFPVIPSMSAHHLRAKKSLSRASILFIRNAVSTFKCTFENHDIANAKIHPSVILRIEAVNGNAVALVRNCCG